MGLLRLIKGGKPPKMKFASFGRERDLNMIEEYAIDPELKARRLRQTSAAHDLNDGVGSLEAFIQASRDAIFESTQRGRDAPLILLVRIAKYYPECWTLWDELAESPRWQDRFTVACRLYWHGSDQMSDRLFGTLRHDKSKKVRSIAIDRYKNRPNERGQIVFDRYDPECFDDRVRRGEVTP